MPFKFLIDRIKNSIFWSKIFSFLFNFQKGGGRNLVTLTDLQPLKVICFLLKRFGHTTQTLTLLIVQASFYSKTTPKYSQKKGKISQK
jgi:hypothetical protein